MGINENCQFKQIIRAVFNHDQLVYHSVLALINQHLGEKSLFYLSNEHISNHSILKMSQIQIIIIIIGEGIE